MFDLDLDPGSAGLRSRPRRPAGTPDDLVAAGGSAAGPWRSWHGDG